MGRINSAITRGVAGVLGTVAPGAAIRYIRKRQALSYYSGASMSGPNRDWRPRNRSEDEAIRQDHAMLRARARDLVRNSSHVSGALRKICNNVIYKGFTPQARLRTNAGKLRETHNPRAEEAWRRWARRVSWHEKENLVLRHLWQDGELFVHWFYDEDLQEDGIIPLNLELLECDHLDTSRTIVSGSSNIKQGIEYNAKGEPIAYWLFPEHPGDNGWLSMAQSKRYPARAVDHIFSRDRISQNRGVPWLSSVIMEMRDFSEYQNAERIAARLAAAFGVFVTTPHPEGAYGGSPIGGEGNQQTVDSLPDYLEPGRIQPVPPGYTIETAKNERPGSTYEPFTKNILRGSSTGFGMSYEAYSNDYTDASYASARSASLEERRGYQVQQALLIRLLHQTAWDRLFGVNSLSRTEGSLPKKVPVMWQTPGWPWVDPDKDSKAAERDIKNGLNSRHKVCLQRGEDYEEVYEDLKREAEDGFPLGGETDAASDTE